MIFQGKYEIIQNNVSSLKAYVRHFRTCAFFCVFGGNYGENKQNGRNGVSKLMIKMGLPIIISMMLQALYNIVDSAFVSNMDGAGGKDNNGRSQQGDALCCA